MASAQQVIDKAYGELGYYAPSDPEPGSKYGRWLAERTGESWLRGPSTSIWWCCMFVSWCLDQTGQAVPGFPTYNTDLAMRGGASGLTVPASQARYGDILIFDWNMSTPATDHIAFCVSNDGSNVKTIDGNVGNAVGERVRPLSWVRYCIRPAYDGQAAGTGIGTGENPNPGILNDDGWIGNLSVTRWQYAMGTRKDGVISGQHRPNAKFFERVNSITWEGGGSQLVQAVQNRVIAHGGSVGPCGADGVLGHDTVAGIQWLVHDVWGYDIGPCGDDGYLGEDTAKAIQRSLNDGRWG